MKERVLFNYGTAILKDNTTHKVIQAIITYYNERGLQLKKVNHKYYLNDDEPEIYGTLYSQCAFNSITTCQDITKEVLKFIK